MTSRLQRWLTFAGHRLDAIAFAPTLMPAFVQSDAQQVEIDGHAVDLFTAIGRQVGVGSCAGLSCLVLPAGNQVPLDRAVLKRLYPRPSDYFSRVKAATQRVLEEQWITREDAAAIESEAQRQRPQPHPR